MHKMRFRVTEWTRWMRAIRYVYRKPEDVGFGDTFENFAKAVGAQKVAQYVKRFRIECGCGNRKQRWNRVFPYH